MKYIYEFINPKAPYGHIVITKIGIFNTDTCVYLLIIDKYMQIQIIIFSYL